MDTHLESLFTENCQQNYGSFLFCNRCDRCTHATIIASAINLRHGFCCKQCTGNTLDAIIASAITLHQFFAQTVASAISLRQFSVSQPLRSQYSCRNNYEHNYFAVYFSSKPLRAQFCCGFLTSLPAQRTCDCAAQFCVFFCGLSELWKSHFQDCGLRLRNCKLRSCPALPFTISSTNRI